MSWTVKEFVDTFGSDNNVYFGVVRTKDGNEFEGFLGIRASVLWLLCPTDKDFEPDDPMYNRVVNRTWTDPYRLTIVSASLVSSMGVYNVTGEESPDDFCFDPPEG